MVFARLDIPRILSLLLQLLLLGVLLELLGLGFFLGEGARHDC
jgi:hypothetical protein